MQVLTLASRKGGAGKTTLARHLAVEAERQGVGRVALIDFDSMRGLTRWWEVRSADTPERVDVASGGLATALPQLLEAGFALVVIDTPPSAEGEVAAAVAVADLVLVPVRPSPDDLRAIGETIALVEAQAKPLIFVVNQATKQALLTGQAAVTLSQHGTVAEQAIHQAQAFPQSGIEGLTVGEYRPGSPPALEITALWGYVAARLRKIAGLPVNPLDALQSSKKDGKKARKISVKEAIQ
jgi:chromosome partitioning protein